MNLKKALATILVCAPTFFAQAQSQNTPDYKSDDTQESRSKTFEQAVTIPEYADSLTFKQAVTIPEYMDSLTYVIQNKDACNTLIKLNLLERALLDLSNYADPNNKYFSTLEEKLEAQLLINRTKYINKHTKHPNKKLIARKLKEFENLIENKKVKKSR